MGEQDSERINEPADQENGGNSEQTPQEKPEPDEKDKEKAAEMMKAYVDKPTLVLPGSGGAISGTAVGDWLDDDGNPKYANDEYAPAAMAKADGDDKDDGETDAHDFEERVEKDKKFNEAVIKAAKEREDAEAGDKDKAEKAEASEDHKAVSK
jgi:hypothetical protein